MGVEAMKTRFNQPENVLLRPLHFVLGRANMPATIKKWTTFLLPTPQSTKFIRHLRHDLRRDRLRWITAMPSVPRENRASEPGSGTTLPINS